ncbi:hypothetical protein PUN28_011910 [Cardiocondyla obscurior]|uniref:RING-type domain-containing protein n=1 Tax=Cardiocondyla obscurior TaxID=286306 RepID=A0AAW2FFZ6_9HYME
MAFYGKEQVLKNTIPKCQAFEKGEANEQLKRKVGRTLQNTNICGDYKTGVCEREVCDRRHIKKKDVKPLECPICAKKITVQTFGATECGNMVCLDCSLKGLENREIDEDRIMVLCPKCKKISEYKRFM